jgi:hypothetical protein
MGHFRWVFRALAIGAITGWLAVLIVRGAGSGLSVTAQSSPSR